jgi:hypothetical protein
MPLSSQWPVVDHDTDTMLCSSIRPIDHESGGSQFCVLVRLHQRTSLRIHWFIITTMTFQASGLCDLCCDIRDTSPSPRLDGGSAWRVQVTGGEVGYWLLTRPDGLVSLVASESVPVVGDWFSQHVEGLRMAALAFESIVSYNNPPGRFIPRF